MKKMLMILTVILLWINLTGMIAPKTLSISDLVEIANVAKGNATLVTNVTDCENLTPVSDDVEVETLYSNSEELECSLTVLDSDNVTYIFHIKK